MTAICIAGSHRSGTSMVTRVLQLAGVDLGAEGELMAPRPDNPGGFFENLRFVDINDRLLNELGGAWDCPPGETDWGHERFAYLREEARLLVDGFSDAPVWGWKDPRNSLTFGFWRQLVPDLVPVIVVRNPLDVAASLHRRNALSYQFGLTLWLRYNERALAETRPGERAVTLYDAYFEDHATEVRRVLAAAGVPVDDAALARAAEGIRPEDRHHTARGRALYDADVAPEVIRLFVELWRETGREVPADVAVAVAAEPASRGPSGTAVEPRGHLEPAGLAHASVGKELSALRGHFARQLDTSGALAERLDRQDVAVGFILDELKSLRAQVVRRVDALESGLAELSWAALQSASEGDRARVRHALARGRVVIELDAVLPADAHVLVAGDEAEALATNLQGREMRPFPAELDGRPMTDLPASDTIPIAQLEYARAVGASYLYFGPASRWLLRKYPRFNQHLTRRYGVVLDDPHLGIAFVLRGSAPDPPAAWEAGLEATVAAFRARYDRDPAILDLTAARGVAAAFPELPVFSPVAPGPQLPHLDESVDLVAVNEGAPAEEAERVAEAAVVTVGRSEVRVAWKRSEGVARPLSASIVIPSWNGIEHTEPCVIALSETLPAAHECEIVVVDDCSTDDTQERLARLAEREPRLRVLRNEENSGFLYTCNRGAAESTGDVVIMLNNDTVPLAGWLEPILRIFRHVPDAGAVTGKLIFPDGSMQDAGGVIFSNGHAANFGKWDRDPDDPLYNYVREVDYGTGALLASPRALWNELGGFDTRYRPIYCEDSDYCFKVWDHGLRVYYQPESVVVHVEGATSGRDESAGDKRYQRVNRDKLAEKWAGEIAQQPAYPARFDRQTLHAIAVRDPREVAA